MYCRQCGNQNADGAGFCKYCGAPLGGGQSSQPHAQAQRQNSQPRRNAQGGADTSLQQLGAYFSKLWSSWNLKGLDLLCFVLGAFMTLFGILTFTGPVSTIASNNVVPFYGWLAILGFVLLFWLTTQKYPAVCAVSNIVYSIFSLSAVIGFITVAATSGSVFFSRANGALHLIEMIFSILAAVLLWLMSASKSVNKAILALIVSCIYAAFAIEVFIYMFITINYGFANVMYSLARVLCCVICALRVFGTLKRA